MFTKQKYRGKKCRPGNVGDRKAPQGIFKVRFMADPGPARMAVKPSEAAVAAALIECIDFYSQRAERITSDLLDVIALINFRSGC